MMKKLFILIILAVVVILGANSYAPEMVAAGIYKSLSPRMTMQRSDVVVHASPGVKILAGRLDAIEIHGRNFKAGDLIIDSVNCQLQNVRFDPLPALLGSRVSLSQAGSGDMDVTIRTADLSQFLTGKVKNLSDVQVEFDNDTVNLHGILNLGGIFKAQASLTGRFALAKNKLMFVPDHLTVEGRGVERSLSMGSVELYDFAGFPFGIQPDSITMQDGLLKIHGRVNEVTD